MSRVTKWKLEKTKVKVVFRLQFHATHVPLSGWDKLFVSFGPAELGKTTAKTTKANVRNGTCKWADPIYETTRLLQDTKTKKYDEKLYKLLVSMGSSRASILGEATINLADYADASKPSSVAMPLHGSSSGVILHITVQLLTSKTGFREFEQQRELRDRGLQMGTELNRTDESSAYKLSSLDASASVEMEKVPIKVKFIPESNEYQSHEERLNEESTDSAVGFDGSSNTSESLYAEKPDFSSTHEADSLKSTVSGDLNGFSQCQSPKREKGDLSDHQFLPLGRSDWVHGWSSDYPIDNSLAVAHEENRKLRGSLEVAEASIQELKMEVSSLQSYADELGGETQKFASKLVAEIASSEELTKEIMLLKSESSKFKDDLEQLTRQEVISPFTSKESSDFEQVHSLQEKQLVWLKGVSVLEDKIKDLQRKAYHGFDERDFSFLYSDLQELLNILQNIKHDAGAVSLTTFVPAKQDDAVAIRNINLLKGEQFVPGTGFDVELYQPENMLKYVTLPDLVSQESESRGASDALEIKAFELLRELDEAKVERENLARKMDQMECYYESLVQELEENQKQMIGELQNLRSEHSICLYTISTKEAEMESIQKDTNEQIVRFAEERHDLDSLNKELQRRAVTAEAALKRTRLNYSIAVDQLQKDLELLSFQVLSMFETNENLMKQTFSETSQPCFDSFPDTLQTTEKPGVAKLSKCLNTSPGIEKQVLGGDILLADMKNSLRLQEDIYQKIEGELSEILSTNLYLDVFTKALKETLVEAISKIRLRKEEMVEIKQQLEVTTESGDVLMARLQSALDEIHTLNEYKAVSISKSSDMLLQNQILEAKLESVSMENCYLKEQIMECELLMKEYKSYQNKYMTCFAEKSELENILKLETVENGSLKIKVSSLKEEVKVLNDKFNETAVLKENLEKVIMFLQDKLGTLLACYDEQLSGQSSSNDLVFQDMEVLDFQGIIMKLEEAQHNVFQKIIQLTEEKKDLQNETHMSSMSLSTVRSDILGMKQKFNHDIKDIEAKLDISNTLVRKLQAKFESVANKFHYAVEAGEKNAQQSEELFTDLAHVELQLHELASKHTEFGVEILGLGNTAEELGKCNMIIAELKQEKQELQMLLQSKFEESVKLASDLDSVKDSLRCVRDDLHVEKGIRDELEGAVAEVSSCKMTIAELLQEKTDLTTLLENKTNESIKLAFDLNSVKDSLRCVQDDLHVEKGIRDELEDAVAELGSCKMTIAELLQEKTDLAMLLENKTNESVKLGSELNNLEQSLKILQGECHVEKGFKDKLESASRDLERSEVTIAELMQEKQDLTMLLDGKTEESVKLACDLDIVKERLISLQDDLLVEKGFRDKLEDAIAELGRSKITIGELMQEKQDLTLLLECKTKESVKLASDLDSMKESLRCVYDELEAEKAIRNKLEDNVTELETSKITIDELVSEKQGLAMLLEAETEKSVKRASDLTSLNEIVRCLKDQLHVEKGFREKVEVTELELRKSKITIAELTQEKQDLTMSLEEKTEESVKLASDFAHLEESLNCLQDKLHVERGFREKLECTVEEITSQLKEEQEKLLCFDGQNAEKVNLRHLESDVDTEKSRAFIHSVQHEDCQEGSSKEFSHLTGLSCQSTELHEHVLSAEVQLAFVKTQYESLIEELLLQLKSSDERYIELQKKHLDLEAILNPCLANEVNHTRENAKLLTTVQILRSELEASVVQNRILSESLDVIMVQLEEYKTRSGTLEAKLSQDSRLHEQLKGMVETADEEICNLIFSEAELEIVMIVLKAKLEEQNGQIALMEESNEEICKLRNQIDDVTRKLSEQILRTEEFKNLSVHLKELKDKAEAECLLAREKKGSEGPSFAVQESLRIAFIKEQYETKLQELRQQLSVSKKHGDEMLWKLQDVVNELEDRKKSEASHLKRTEELSVKVLELEAELQSVFSDKREKSNAYDRIQTELDCAVLSLECCKEEKEKLEASLRECEEKCRITAELALRRDQLENSIGSMDTQKEVAVDTARGISADKASFVTTIMDVSDGILTSNLSPEYAASNDSNNHMGNEQILDTRLIPFGKAEESIQVPVSKDVHGISEHNLANETKFLLSKSKDVVVANNLRAETLKSSMDHLHEELERMKNENSHLPQANYEPYVQDLQRELVHLHKANQELGSMFPLFNNFLGSGNALERVLALEIELAEALSAKKTSSFHIQSSFLKQHPDEEAVLKSFRDINELIKDMLELKAKYASVETELKEMHDRYSDLSLQFAEVEGERQKLAMTLKNIRTAKKPVHLSHSSSDTLGDNTS